MFKNFMSLGTVDTVDTVDTAASSIPTTSSVVTDGLEYINDSASLSTTPVGSRSRLIRSVGSSANDIGVGLSDEVISQARREMLNLVDRLHSVGVQSDISLPHIVVIGSQSSGKSSLIEGISGIKLPRASGTCTRCPMELRLKRSDAPWRCDVFLRFVHDEDAKYHGHVAFGSPITDPDEVEDRLKRAQLAILNPLHPPTDFLRNPIPSASHSLGFSQNHISVQVQGPNMTDLSFYDLPGWIASAKHGKTSDVTLIEELLVSYIEKPSCLILLTVSCEADFEVQGAHQLVKKYDPDGQRTIGVLTKPDRIAEGDQDQWIRFVKNEEEPLDLGWFSVKQPDALQLKQRLSWAQARAAEEEWFRATEPWNALPIILPELQEELDELLQTTEDEIKELPAPPSDDALAEMMRIIASFCNEVARHTEGISAGEGLVQSINTKQAAFRRSVLSVSPKFRPYKLSEAYAALTPEPPIEFLDGEEEDKVLSEEAFSMDVEEVMQLLKHSRTRELPDFYPYDVPKQIIEKTMRKWEAMAFDYFYGVQTVLYEHFKKLIDEHFKHFQSGGLLNTVLIEAQTQIKGRRDETKQRLKWLLQIESRPFTLNTRYLAEYKSKFLAYYKTYRYKALNSTPLNRLQSYNSGHRGDVDYIAEALVALNKADFKNVKEYDLAKLLPEDDCESALEVMATVSAYFQVSCKRFIDVVPSIVDYDFVQGFSRDIQGVLYGVIIKDNANARCRSFLQESPATAARRSKLQMKHERLEAARNELSTAIPAKPKEEEPSWKNE
ncbi:hypothetical protein EW145_g1875 [Phellinidium pouzarii]|uniref:GED domain-containing protein n=1 Tax=Phellinidium pouzarii TaxID=167371 RepID=A0A4S4LET6_9AGAM|nr:hypothetical protein EW145_g1875 [Phellinidium pouzarii]